jgi:hypothetical protein
MLPGRLQQRSSGLLAVLSLDKLLLSSLMNVILRHVCHKWCIVLVNYVARSVDEKPALVRCQTFGLFDGYHCSWLAFLSLGENLQVHVLHFELCYVSQVYLRAPTHYPC